MKNNMTKEKAAAIEAINELKAGREVVVIAGDKDYDSAIMWLSEDLKTRYGFAREIGEMALDFNEAALLKHFEGIVADGGMLIVRGLAFDER